MSKPLDKFKASIQGQVGKASHKVTEKFNEEVEEIIYKVIASEQIEAIVIQAVEQVILSLAKRYWLLLVVSVFVLLGLQSIFLSIALTALRDFK